MSKLGHRLRIEVVNCRRKDTIGAPATLLANSRLEAFPQVGTREYFGELDSPKYSRGLARVGQPLP